MNELLLRHTPSICLRCRDNVHRCEYGDSAGDCWRSGKPMVVNDTHLVFYCREHAAIAVPRLEA